MSCCPTTVCVNNSGCTIPLGPDPCTVFPVKSNIVCKTRHTMLRPEYYEKNTCHEQAVSCNLPCQPSCAPLPNCFGSMYGRYGVPYGRGYGC